MVSLSYKAYKDLEIELQIQNNIVTYIIWRPSRLWESSYDQVEMVSSVFEDYSHHLINTLIMYINKHPQYRQKVMGQCGKCSRLCETEIMK